MDWTVPWYSSFGSDFNYDFHVTTDAAIAPVEYNYQDADLLLRKGQTYHLHGEQPGVSVFLRDDVDRLYHTYSAFARGLDILDGTYNWLDLTPFGRQEEWEDSPAGWPQSPTHEWLRHHDSYREDDGDGSCCSAKQSAPV
jgi:predicted dithiol-disulfide oxidoreductase (DUF899 family)